VVFHPDDSREAFYARYLKEMHGDHAQTQLLSANYKLIALEEAAEERRTLKDSVKDPSDDCGLEFGDATYTDLVNHGDTIFEEVIKECYGRFVVSTEPIVSQVTTMKRLTDHFKQPFPVQYNALAKLLNYEERMRRKDREHLFDFYNRMIVYKFMSICRVRCDKIFS
jgi:hypothetical protein